MATKSKIGERDGKIVIFLDDEGRRYHLKETSPLNLVMK